MDDETRKSGRSQLRFGQEDDPPGGESEPTIPWRLYRHAHAWNPSTDVYETDHAYIVVVEVAGMRGGEFSVTFDQQILNIRGARADKGGPKAYHQMEIAYGEFACAVRVNAPVDASLIQASYNDGFLRVELPKLPPRRISISS
jgi:HSP20 family protein